MIYLTGSIILSYYVKLSFKVIELFKLNTFLIKFAEDPFLDQSNKTNFLVMAFAMAAVIGVIVLFFLLFSGRQVFSLKAISAAITLGMLNFFSI